MGNLRIKQEVFIYSHHQWQALPQLNSQLLMLDTQTGIIGEAQPIKDITQKYIDSLEFRVRNNKCLVDVLAIKMGSNLTCLTGSTISCSNMNKQQGITVFIQNISYRLPDLGSLNYKEGIYVLHQCLAAIKIIFLQYPNLLTQFEQEMIGFNKAGKCKFWINANYFKDAQNNASNSNNAQHTNNFDQIVSALFLCIQQRMSCELTKDEQEEYQKLKRQTLKFTGNNKSIQFIQNGLRMALLLSKNNKIDFSTFSMRIAELQQTQFIQKTCIPISPNKSIISRLNKMSQKNKISLKRKVSQDKKYELNSQGLKRQNIQLHKRTSQSTLFQSIQFTDTHTKQKINYPQTAKNSNRIITILDHSHELKRNQGHVMKFSRSTLMTRDSEYSSMIKYEESPKKMVLGINIRRKIIN